MKFRTPSGIPLETWEHRHPVVDSTLTIVVLVVVIAALFILSLSEGK